jgi:hypothetical protein
MRTYLSDPQLRLQWGRDLIVAETRALLDELCRARPLLQWGRDLIVAETTSSRAWRPRSNSCFNGAAT